MPMFKRSFFHGAALLCSVFTILCHSTAYADGAGIILNEIPKYLDAVTNIEEEDVKTFLTDEEFKQYADYMLRQTDDPAESTMKLYLFITGGAATRKQTEDLIREGYFHDCIDDFKAAGVLDEDYVIPLGVLPIKMTEIKPVTRMSGTVPEDAEHDFDGITEDAEQALRSLYCDDVSGNVWINIPAGSTDKFISGKVLSLNLYNIEPTDINLLSDDGYSDVSWHFENVLVKEDSEIDLSVEHDESHIEFSLGKNTFHYPARVMIRMQEPEAKYNIYEKTGRFRETLMSDRKGYITMEVSDQSASCNVAVERIDAATASDADDTKTEIVKPETEEPDMTALQMLVTAIGIMMFGFLGIAWHASKGGKS